MRPKVVRARGFLFYPVRRAASSAIQMALGYDFVDWKFVVDNYSTFHRFTCYRNTFDRLRSLFYNFVYPAPQGFVTFELPVQQGDDFSYEGSFDEWVTLVCKTKDENCNEHLHSQDWDTFVPNLTIYRFEDRETLFDRILHKRVEQLGQPSPDLSHLVFDEKLERLVEKRYAREIFEMRYFP